MVLSRCRAFALAGLAALTATPAAATGGPVEVDVELVISVDVSYSMDEEEQRLQRGGYIDALKSGEFHAALQNGAYRKIAVAYVEWASYHDVRTLVNWSVIDGPETARAFAERLAEAPYRRARRTSVSGAIDYSASIFPGNGFNGTRRVIDVSGDGPNNDGRPVTRARDEAVAKGFVINGLPLVSIRPNLGYADITNLDVYYADCVIGGPGAFMIPIRDRAQFVEATRTKLVLEVALLPPTFDSAPRPQFAQTKEPRINCMVGETMWNQRWGN